MVEAPAAIAVSDAQAGVFRPGAMPAFGAYADNGWLALGARARAGILRELADLVKEYPGESPVYVSLETSLGPKTLALGPQHRVAIDSDFLTDARLRLGVDALQ